MNLDLGTLCLLGIGLIVLFMLIPRLMGNGGGTRGSYRPQYDDPNIDSGTGFGGTGDDVRPQYNDPDIDSRSGFGRAFGNMMSRRRGSGGSPLSAGSRSSSEPTKPSGFDSPDVDSRSGFGRPKK